MTNVQLTTTHAFAPDNDKRSLHATKLRNSQLACFHHLPCPLPCSPMPQLPQSANVCTIMLCSSISQATKPV